MNDKDIIKLTLTLRYICYMVSWLSMFWCPVIMVGLFDGEVLWFGLWVILFLFE